MTCPLAKELGHITNPASRHAQAIKNFAEIRLLAAQKTLAIF
jgi:hypothetical protein